MPPTAITPIITTVTAVTITTTTTTIRKYGFFFKLGRLEIVHDKIMKYICKLEGVFGGV